MISIGKNNLLQGNLNDAAKWFNSALEIFEENKHPDTYIVLENLGDFTFKQLMLVGDNDTSNRILKNKAILYLTRAFAYYKEHFFRRIRAPS